MILKVITTICTKKKTQPGTEASRLHPYRWKVEQCTLPAFCCPQTEHFCWLSRLLWQHKDKQWGKIGVWPWAGAQTGQLLLEVRQTCHRREARDSRFTLDAFRGRPSICMAAIGRGSMVLNLSQHCSSLRVSDSQTRLTGSHKGFPAPSVSDGFAANGPPWLRCCWRDTGPIGICRVLSAAQQKHGTESLVGTLKQLASIYFMSSSYHASWFPLSLMTTRIIMSKRPISSTLQCLRPGRSTFLWSQETTNGYQAEFKWDSERLERTTHKKAGEILKHYWGGSKSGQK